MDNYRQNLREEKLYLEKTLKVIQKELETESGKLSHRKRNLIEARKDMWENTAHSSNDFTKLVEMSQYLLEVNSQTASYLDTSRQVDRYRKIIESPYFGRFDFTEDGCRNEEKIYVGLYTVMDSETNTVRVYDWRAPISSIFYRYEPGRAEYTAPAGLIAGEVLLKRQYKIRNSELVYFFDCNILINDKILQEILSRNASAKMRNIVETIQKEQDLIIRDTGSDLLIVQGVAGSGKTSIALHRVAYLLYDGLKTNLGSHNVIIISPNAVFSKYISNVLPELGEENVRRATFDDIAAKAFENRLTVENRAAQLEAVIGGRDRGEIAARRQGIIFKGSKTFAEILDRLLTYCGRRLIPFEDVYYNGVILETKQQLKNRFLNNKTGIPMARQLQRIENMLLDKVHPLQKKRLRKIEKIVAQSDGREFEVKSFSRLLSIKEAGKFQKRLHKFTRVDYLKLYQRLFQQRELFFELSRGLELPEDIHRIISSTGASLQKGLLRYEDAAPLLYLKLKIDGYKPFSEIKQVVIDEAQDYYPLHYEVFKLLFGDAKYTVLGDINQTIEKEKDNSIYEDISEILNKQKTIKLSLNKGYRSSYEINDFTQRLLGGGQDFVPFERHEKEPVIQKKKTKELIDRAIAADVRDFMEEGYESVAVICKTQQEANKVHSGLKKLIPAKLIQARDGRVEKGALVIPSYLAKGLEFDAVIVHDAGRENYSGRLDKKLLYVACTRALHRLCLYYTGEKSPFIEGAGG
ncbi:HelD family protein [Desulfocucumis palustris]|uniref:HelD family protein n=1 Tax=Desulfocucumis palustris TaxID=1898651 RepID=UPI000CEA3D64|nr:UvrD-helicase domain-containing protein [Desulfocucumis palustris]